MGGDSLGKKIVKKFKVVCGKVQECVNVEAYYLDGEDGTYTKGIIKSVSCKECGRSCDISKALPEEI